MKKFEVGKIYEVKKDGFDFSDGDLLEVKSIGEDYISCKYVGHILYKYDNPILVLVDGGSYKLKMFIKENDVFEDENGNIYREDAQMTNPISTEDEYKGEEIEVVDHRNAGQAVELDKNLVDSDILDKKITKFEVGKVYNAHSWFTTQEMKVIKRTGDMITFEYPGGDCHATRKARINRNDNFEHVCLPELLIYANEEVK